LGILLNVGADPEARDLDQNTPLIIAAKAGKFEAVEWLLDHGADIRAVTERNKTALDWATENGHERVARLLQARAAG
jgi:ankyrin repeat protein